MSDVFTESELDKKSNPSGEQQVTSGQSGTISGQSQAPKEQTDSNSGQFVNLQGYLNANQGEAANQTAKGVVDRWGGDSQAAQNEVGTQANDFKSNVQKNTFGFSDQDKNTVQNSASSLNPNTVAGYSKWYQQGEYTGPKAADVPAAMQSSKVDAIQSELGNTTPEGLKVSLANTYGKDGNYSAGDQSLDNMLITRDPTASTALDTGRTGTLSNLTSYLDTTKTGLTDAANTAQAGTNTAIGSLKGAVTAGKKSEAGIVADRLAAKQAADKAAALAQAKKEMATQTAASKNGVDARAKYNLEDFLTNNGTDYRSLGGDTAGVQSINDANALGTISGEGPAYGALDRGGPAYGVDLSGISGWLKRNEKTGSLDESGPIAPPPSVEVMEQRDAGPAATLDHPVVTFGNQPPAGENWNQSDRNWYEAHHETPSQRREREYLEAHGGEL